MLGLAFNIFVGLIAFAFLTALVVQQRLLRRIGDSLQVLHHKSEFQDGLLLSEHPERELFDLDRRLEGARTIDLVGYSMAPVLSAHREKLVQALVRGAKVRVLLLDPLSTAGQLMKDQFDDSRLVDEPHERSVRYIRDITGAAYKGMHASTKVQVRGMNWVPAYTMILINRDQHDGAILMGINSLVLTKGRERRMYLVVEKSRFGNNFELLASQFDALWKTSREIHIDEPLSHHVWKAT